MINSVSKELNQVKIPFYNGEVSMLPFNLNDLSNIPMEFVEVVKQMISNLPELVGEAYLTVHGKFVKKSKTLRRGAPHIDGNYLKEVSTWGGNGWKVGQHGVKLSSNEHKISYENNTGGMLIASNYSACKGWNGTFDYKAKEGGDCSHIPLEDGFHLKENVVYYGNSQFIHESLPLDRDVHRVLFRITLPTNYPLINF